MTRTQNTANSATPPTASNVSTFPLIRFPAVLAAFLFLRQATKRFILVLYLVSVFQTKFLFPKYERDYCLIAICIGLFYILCACPRGLRRKSMASCLLRLWVRKPPGAWMSVCYECCVLSGRGLYDGLIIRSQESYRLCFVVDCDHETSQARRLKPSRGL